MVYYIVLFAYMVLAQYSYRNSKGNEVAKMVITFLPLFLFGSLRVSCGDYEIYELYNKWVRTASYQIMDVIERMEPGYAYLNKLLPYRWIIVLSSLLACYAYGVLFAKVIPQKYRWFIIFLFFLVADKTFYFMFSSIRNSIAMSILIIYMVYRIDNYSKKHSIVKELIILVIITAFASMFHASARVFFPIVFFATINKKIDGVEFYIWIIVLIILLILPVNQFMDSHLFQADYFSRYDYYLNRKERRDVGSLVKFGSTLLAILCFIDIRLNADEDKKNIFSRPMLLYVYSYLLGSLNIRVSYYFFPFVFVYLTYVFMNRGKSKWTTVLLVFAIVFMFYSSFIAGTLGDTTMSPFITYKISLFQ